MGFDIGSLFRQKLPPEATETSGHTQEPKQEKSLLQKARETKLERMLQDINDERGGVILSLMKSSMRRPRENTQSPEQQSPLQLSTEEEAKVNQFITDAVEYQKRAVQIKEQLEHDVLIDKIVRYANTVLLYAQELPLEEQDAFIDSYGPIEPEKRKIFFQAVNKIGIAVPAREEAAAPGDAFSINAHKRKREAPVTKDIPDYVKAIYEASKKIDPLERGEWVRQEYIRQKHPSDEASIRLFMDTIYDLQREKIAPKSKQDITSQQESEVDGILVDKTPRAWAGFDTVERAVTFVDRLQTAAQGDLYFIPIEGYTQQQKGQNKVQAMYRRNFVVYDKNDYDPKNEGIKKRHPVQLEITRIPGKGDGILLREGKNKSGIPTSIMKAFNAEAIAK